jgi:Cu+-exporting ATPase
MKFIVPLSFFVSLVFVSCSEGNKKVSPEVAVLKEKVVKVVGNRLLTLEIEGMTCVMGCGGTIRKELAATKAIESCKFEFEEGRAKNTAKISFDKDKISVDKIISIVSKLNKGQFKVGNSASEDVSVNIRTKVEEISSDKGENGQLKVATETEIEIPNFVEILATFFHN